LSVVVEREEKIRAFVSRNYWEIHANFAAQAGDYPGKWFDPDWKKASANAAAGNTEPDAELKADRLWTIDQAQAIRPCGQCGANPQR
jgi:DNA topoisomerase-3